ncbi:hypothetical protein Ahy_A09g046317 isoform G [Arachis hypogaea]|uniref:Uncharacterized protein n=1 Tax=Arachis hypogaea TaxID=3818 RepID=A0A445BPJ7_ARAHY|nr:hypothetical protein Ahy_A09g046317 isoform G [Arachis hypogaea]
MFKINYNFHQAILLPLLASSKTGHLLSTTMINLVLIFKVKVKPLSFVMSSVFMRPRTPLPQERCMRDGYSHDFVNSRGLNFLHNIKKKRKVYYFIFYKD